MKRQIIKTKPERPYRIARLILFLLVLALGATLAYVIIWPHGRVTHTGAPSRTTVRQDFAFSSRNSQSPVIPK